MKNNAKFIFLIILPFILISSLAAYFFVGKFHPSYTGSAVDTNWAKSFVENEYPELKDLAKTFLTLIIGVFVASITFSEKIVNHQTSSALSRSLLLACWLCLLLSIILVGAGICFSFGCFEQALYDSTADNDLYDLVAICYILAGILFGFGLTFILSAGTLSFLRPKESFVEAKKERRTTKISQMP